MTQNERGGCQAEAVKCCYLHGGGLDTASHCSGGCVMPRWALWVMAYLDSSHFEPAHSGLPDYARDEWPRKECIFANHQCFHSVKPASKLVEHRVSNSGLIRTSCASNHTQIWYLFLSCDFHQSRIPFSTPTDNISPIRARTHISTIPYTKQDVISFPLGSAASEDHAQTPIILSFFTLSVSRERKHKQQHLFSYRQNIKTLEIAREERLL